jgi:GNAT superfamily N-acetyltransferase
MIRRLAPDDVGLLKELRLGALADSPSAFGSTYEREAAYSDVVWRFLLRPDGHPTFVWEDRCGAQGMVVAVCDENDDSVVHLVAMWVRPVARGSGAADALVGRVLGWARERSSRIVRLRVTSGNEPAERLYARHGFVPTGRTDSRERDGRAEIEMEAVL